MQPYAVRFHTDQGRVPRYISVEVAEFVKMHEKEHLYIEVGRVKKYRSGNQNSYYHGVVIPGIQRVFYKHGDLIDAAYAHEFAKKELGKGIFAVTRSKLTGDVIIESSASLDTARWETWMTNIRRWAAMEGEQIKEPNEE